MEQVDFAERSKLCKEINFWANEATTALSRTSSKRAICAQTPLFICNAFYFKAFWTHQFCTQHIKKLDFKIDAKRMKKVNYLCKLGRKHHNYHETKDVKILRMTYRTSPNIKHPPSPSAMYVFLPTTVKPIQTLFDGFDGESLGAVEDYDGLRRGQEGKGN
ncbi:hypothetical protein L596_022050 [Steinernema carpocapsae]|uniref:Serpin domain-containing protein n=1 Tax=Steinernema carpocapsae TaxID=34508 RepID=A0A4U5MKL2_STECR|nr:hypothetical protein L596_022050 [Steinernema carpocapsae]